MLTCAQVFLDKRCLQVGDRFDKSFSKALCNSTVITPIVSIEALHRMAEHDPSTVDNVLLEWILSLECCSNKASRVLAVYPILIGKREFTSDMICSDVGNIFATGVFSIMQTIFISLMIPF
jgi:hypothetical protein